MKSSVLKLKWRGKKSLSTPTVEQLIYFQRWRRRKREALRMKRSLAGPNWPCKESGRPACQAGGAAVFSLDNPSSTQQQQGGGSESLLKRATADGYLYLFIWSWWALISCPPSWNVGMKNTARKDFNVSLILQDVLCFVFLSSCKYVFSLKK